MTYNSHNATDVSMLTMANERRGVNLLATALGKVLRVRDGMADVFVAVTGRNAIKNRDCRNGCVIAPGCAAS